jgi:tyrosyl-tRNA synthetase
LQKAIAEDITRRVHGEEALQTAISASNILFGKSTADDLKKLSEKDRLFETRMCLENENSDVKRKIESTQTEINYLKSLLVQLLLTKGVLDTKF